ncbi:metal-dependent hydrolase [Fundidesulfovibrio putealis]|uniref:metal-dependent hydrolase n=1 Tax=Fundidesulfovibrio putealis TaxID=270496 RepID=UPI00048276E5|nr:metal-dependent hydrolase [Fundidesulfovibrio putealis]
MPGFKGHIAGSLAATGAVLGGAWWLGVYRPEPKVMAMLAVLGVLGALFPDVDTNSKGRHLYYGAAVIADAVLILKGEYRYAALLGFCAILPAVGSHRGWTHTWWAALVIPSPILIAPIILMGMTWQPLMPFYLAAVLGYYSHLFMDGMI